MPLRTKGIEITAHVATTDAIPPTVRRGVNGIASCTVRHSGIEMPKSSENSHMRCLTALPGTGSAADAP